METFEVLRRDCIQHRATRGLLVQPGVAPPPQRWQGHGRQQHSSSSFFLAAARLEFYSAVASSSTLSSMLMLSRTP
jgi:hypothetical protein